SPAPSRRHRVWPDRRFDFGRMHRWDDSRRQWAAGRLQCGYRGHHACSLKITFKESAVRRSVIRLLRGKSALPIRSESTYYFYKVGASENAHAQASSHEESHSRDSFRRDGVDFCRPAGLDGPTTRESTIRLPRARRRNDRRSDRCAIAAEGELKATIRTFQRDNPSAVYRYYWWHDSCYVRFQSGNYQLVASDYCQH